MREKDYFFMHEKTSASFNGYLDQKIRYIEQIQLLRPELWKRFSGQFAQEDADFDNRWRGEYWGKMMRGACLVYQYTKNPALYALLEETVEDLLACQEESGRISCYHPSHEFQSWDLWERKYVLLGMEYFLEICRRKSLSEKVIASMRGQADYLIERIGSREEGKLPITETSAIWRGVNSSSILEPIARLYGLTGEERYRQFAEEIIRCGGARDGNLFQLAYADHIPPYQYPVTKAYETISCFEGLLAFYRATGVERYKTAAVQFGKQLLKTDFTVIGCCGTYHEQFDHSTNRQANTNNVDVMQETCVTVTVMKFFYQLLLLTGDPTFADAFERSLYNAYLGSYNTEQKIGRIQAPASDRPFLPEPLPFDSYSPLTAGIRGVSTGGFNILSDGSTYGCCACIGAAGCGLIDKVAVLSFPEGVAVNLFLSGVVTTATPAGNPLTLRIETCYPREGRVRAILSLEQPEEFTLTVRIPAWSKETSLLVNGKPQPVQRGFSSVRRLWSSGDEVLLELDMTTRVIRPPVYSDDLIVDRISVDGREYAVATYDRQDEKAKYHIALQRGPIMLAQENRLGYSVDEPMSFAVQPDDTIEAILPKQDIAPYEHMVEVCVPLTDGRTVHLTDYASAGKTWNTDSKMAVWMLTKEAQN